MNLRAISSQILCHLFNKYLAFSLAGNQVELLSPVIKATRIMAISEDVAKGQTDNSLPRRSTITTMNRAPPQVRFPDPLAWRMKDYINQLSQIVSNREARVCMHNHSLYQGIALINGQRISKIQILICLVFLGSYAIIYINMSCLSLPTSS